MEWSSLYANDPGDDYELVIELLYKEKDVAVIRHKEKGLELTWYANENNLNIPVDWLLERLIMAKRDLKRDTSKNNEE